MGRAISDPRLRGGPQEGTVSAVCHRESPQPGESILTLLCRGAKTQGLANRLGFEVDFSVCWIFWGCFLKGSLDDLDSNMFLLEFRGGSHCECPSVGTGRNTIDQMVNRMTARRNDLFQPTKYPLVNIQKAIEHGAIEIVDFPSKNGDFP